MIPYNEKLWGVDLEEMNTTWVRGRFPKINIEELKQQCEERKVIAWGDNAYFRYPKYGGNGGSWDKLANEVLPKEKMHPGHKVKTIDPLKKQLTFDNGSTSTYEYLLSTMPITTLLESL